MDFLISLMLALIIMLLVGLISQAWYKFSYRNQMPEGWHESGPQRELREALEKEHWEISQRAIKKPTPGALLVPEPALRLPRNAG